MPVLDVLGLRVRIGEEPGSGRVDLEVSLLGDGPWPAGLVDESERVCYTSPEVDETSGVPIITVWEHGAGTPSPRPAGPFYRVRYWDASEFLVDRAGTRIWARWPPAVSDAEIRLCLLGPIIGFVLHLRGTPCLHASAVAVDGRAVAFLGHSGAGKSTTAAAFVRRGFRALTDDVLALDEGQGAGFSVRPGHNLVRLWPDAVRALYGSDEALPAGGDTTDKRHLDLTGPADAFHAEPLPLGAIYVIADRREDAPVPAEITALKGHEALMALVARTYMNYVLDSTLRVRALTVFARLAAQVPIRQLIVRHDADNLGALTDAILADLASL